MDNDSDKMLRALAGQLGNQIKEYLRKVNMADFLSDRTAITISDWETERTFRDLVVQMPELRDNPGFMHEWVTFRQEELTQYLNVNKDSLGAIAMLYDSSNDKKESMNVLSFIYSMKSKGPDNQGDVIEILGPMRSGKTNFMVWMMEIAQANHINIVTNIPLKAQQDRIHEVHRLSEVLIEIATIRKTDKNALTWIMLDEQAGIKGSGSRTATTKETRWADNFIRLIGKFGASLWRARQFDDVIKEQKGLVSVEFKKSTGKLDSVEGEFKHGLYAGTEIYFNNIKDETDRYDTRSISSFQVDIDMEIFNEKMASIEKQVNELNISQEQAIIKITKEMLQDKNMKTPQKVRELAAKGYEAKEIANLTGYSLKQVYRLLNGE